MKNWTICYRLDGSQPRQRTRYAMDGDTAKAAHAAIARHLDPGATLIDLLAEARETFPDGQRIRHDAVGREGTVADVRIGHPSTAEIHVRWDHGCTSWIDAAFITAL